eukprot:CAMPEP_0119019622 /NCGR_PEP_ID=MMETSP1176-20130426/22304_1 /TAXON_ID=265551 /ORGANISM="Synedropsis recta cf, Strain CCMP1620" /LENGTH=402 /DNA_ID=CAMNT_0006973869 /DNA_START=60 /DNA_END=1268 /DNA_ORIENTATION=+
MAEYEDDGAFAGDDDGSFDSADSAYSSEDNVEDLDDAFASYMQAQLTSMLPEKEVQESPEALWRIFLSSITSGKSKVLKVTDACFERYGLADADTKQPLTSDVVSAVIANPGLTHVILGDQFLQRIEQMSLFQTVSAHADALTYLKLSPEQGTLNVSAFFGTLAAAKKLSELEIHNLTLLETGGLHQVAHLGELLAASSLRQVYIFGIKVDSSEQQLGQLDPILRRLSALEPLDELRLEGVGIPAEGSMVSINGLRELLVVKQKWWRLGLDNLALCNEHCAVIAEMFSRNDKCKAGDLLSLKSNPSINHVGYKAIFDVFYKKGRMGLVKVDDKLWEAEFDLVRSMNNLHGRLDIVKDGKVASKGDWLDWVSHIGSGGWEGDSKKLNYIWFALREHPEMLVSR